MQELHSRMAMPLRAPAEIFHVTFLCTPVEGTACAGRLLTALAALPSPEAEAPRYGVIETAIAGRAAQVKWEHHTEFLSTSVAVSGEAGADTRPAVEALLDEVFSPLGPRRLAAVHIQVEQADGLPAPRTLTARFPTGSCAGAVVNGGEALVALDFHIDDDGYSRALIQNWGLTEDRLGRLVQRILEIETYRAAAFLAFPQARETMAVLTEMERRLEGTVSRIRDSKTAAEDRAILDSLTDLAVDLGHLVTRNRWRFGASLAYGEIVSERLEELREERIPGLQRVGLFLKRRLRPGIRTVEAADRLQGELAAGMERAQASLRTRVDVGLSSQSATLLTSLDRNSRMHVRIQEAVEALSIVGITYYLVSLVEKVMHGLPETEGWPSTSRIVAIAVPVCAGVVAVAARWLRRNMPH
ncbi:putative membrane-anchored protein [Nitrospirillum iridis]|uniref:Putative membrane-anchored protein n=2 Tax=Nitrospirillum iridis TaxID=765888 RepID=A0A7X0AYT1_9PROT|nr:putative membrane-anchored protein [Nitrospirillum iridis]